LTEETHPTEMKNLVLYHECQVEGIKDDEGSKISRLRHALTP
jgi:hypothetical protein